MPQKLNPGCSITEQHLWEKSDERFIGQNIYLPIIAKNKDRGKS